MPQEFAVHKASIDSFLSDRILQLYMPVFRRVATLANQYEAINLGGGTPDFTAPSFIKAAAIEAVGADFNQYGLSQGNQMLREGIAERLYKKYGCSFDPETEITVCCGVTEGMVAAMLTIVNPGDEVIIIEPAFMIYAADVILCGGYPVYVKLQPPRFRIDRQVLAAAVSPRTKAIVVNSPHNPTGRVFDQEELSAVADICREYGLVAITDEIYDELLYDGITPVKLWTLPGMAGRTIMINGFSKTYSVTGWRLGYIVAPPELTQAIRVVHNYLTISAATPLQQAAAQAVRVEDDYYDTLRTEYLVRRDLLLEGLAREDIPCFTPQGGYFVLADVSRFGWQDDAAFVEQLIKTTRVAAIPLSGFYDKPPDDGQLWLRFAFCKKTETLQAALQRLHQNINKLNRNGR